MAVGVMSALEADDAVVSTYREHGHALAKGIPPEALLAEMFGRVEGTSRGRGGSMHIFDAATRFYGGNAIVGGGFLAAGLALADAMQHRDRVTGAFLRRGRHGRGRVPRDHQPGGLCGGCPCLSAARTTCTRRGTALARSESQTDLALKASVRLLAQGRQGMDVLEGVADAAHRAVLEVRGGDRRSSSCAPTGSERTRCTTPSGTGRSEEVERWRERDPIDLLVARSLAAETLQQRDVDALEDEVAREFRGGGGDRGGRHARTGRGAGPGSCIARCRHEDDLPRGDARLAHAPERG